MRIRVVALQAKLIEVAFLIPIIEILDEVIELADQACRPTGFVSINTSIKLKRISITVYFNSETGSILFPLKAGSIIMHFKIDTRSKWLILEVIIHCF